MSKDGKQKILGGIFKLLGLIIGMIFAAYAWFINNPTGDFGELSVRTNLANEILMSLDNGQTWDNTLELNLSNDFKFNNELTSDGLVFYKALNKREDGTPVTFQSAISNADYLDIDVWFKARENTTIFLEKSSYVVPASGTSSNELIGPDALNKSGDGDFSKDLIAGSVRVAFIENIPTGPTSFTDGTSTKLVWAPNKNYELTFQNDYYAASIESTNIQEYNYVDPNEDTYYFEKRVPNIKDNISASYEDLLSHGDPMIVSIDNDNQEIKSVTIRIWIEGNDRDALTALRGGIFGINIAFVGITKEFNNSTPNVSANTSTNRINNYASGMQCSSDFGNNWSSYEDVNNPTFALGDTIYVRYEETETAFASNYIELNY